MQVERFVLIVGYMMAPIGIIYGEDGTAYTYGVYEISGAQYYFDMYSRMAVSEVCTEVQIAI